jgi:hypothetical protein
VSKRRSSIQGKAKGILSGLEENQTKQENINNELKPELVKESESEEKEKKINRSYMISESTLSKLQELKIKNPAMTYSDLVEEAINCYYKNINK